MGFKRELGSKFPLLVRWRADPAGRSRLVSRLLSVRQEKFCSKDSTVLLRMGIQLLPTLNP